MLKNLNPEILTYDSKFVYKMKSLNKKIPQFKTKEKKTYNMNKEEINM